MPPQGQTQRQPGPQQQQQAQLQQQPEAPSRIALLVLLAVFFLLNSSDPRRDVGLQNPTVREQADAKIERQRHSLAVLNQTNYADFAPLGRGEVPLGGTQHWLNLTGFRRDDGYAWDLLDEARGLARARAAGSVDFNADVDGDGAGGAVGLNMYRNITGVARGRWVRHEVPLETRGNAAQRYNLSEIAPKVSWAYGAWDRNISGTEGKMMLSVDSPEVEDPVYQEEKEPLSAVDTSIERTVSAVSATLTIQDENSKGDGWEMRLHGAHWPHNGAAILTTTSEKFYGIFGLPHLTLDDGAFESSKKMLNRSLYKTTQKRQESWGIPNYPWASDQERIPTPHCEYVVYIQEHSLRVADAVEKVVPGQQGSLSLEIEALEKELRFPTGRPMIEPPPLQMSMVIYSPDCGFILETKGPPRYPQTAGNHMIGMKYELYISRIKNWTLFWSFLMLFQVYLLRIQIGDSSTPSTVSRVSMYTIAIMVFADALIFSSGMFMAISVMELFPSATIAGFAGVLATGIGVRFIADIFAVQEPERREQERAAAAAAAAAAALAAPASTPALAVPVITAAGVESLPVSATVPGSTPSRETPIIIPSDQDIDAEIAEVANAARAVPTLPTTIPNQLQPQRIDPRAEFATTYGQFVLVMFAFLFLSMSAVSWAPIYRSVYVNTTAFLYLSFWWPQIYRNAQRNCRKALLWRYVVGQSVARAAPLAYFYLAEDNVLFAETDWVAMSVLAGWLWLQVWVLVAQEVLGPRFGLPDGWTAEAWEYHPVLREDDVEGAGMPVGLVKTPSAAEVLSSRTSTDQDGDRRASASQQQQQQHSTWSVDCPICMQTLELPFVPAGETATTTTSTSDAVGSVAGMLARRLYMVTPCRHVFHSKCLEGWMRFRLACPICRENLPPL